MANRRDQIRMTDAEIDEFLAGRHSMSVATHGPDGDIHLVAMWYGFTSDGLLAFETYAKSQKIRNLERNPSITVLVETGETYDQLRGVEIVGRGRVVTDDEGKREIAESVVARYWDFGDDQAAIDIAIAGLMNKRVGVVIEPTKVVSWDHSKL